LGWFVVDQLFLMSAPILIVGQGLAGSLLAWEFERAGIDFEIADAGHTYASSRIGAGIINPVTGQRLVKSWRVDALLPAALATYRELESALGLPLLTPMRVRRFFHDERERRVFAEKLARGELAPYAGAADEAGFFIEGAARVDTAVLIAAMRVRLRTAGRLREEQVDVSAERARRDLVILCTGAARVSGEAARVFDFARLQPAKGETLTLELAEAGAAPVAAEVILNDGHWVLPLADGRLRVGATFEPGVADRMPTATAREALERSAARLLQRKFRVVAHEAGLRVTTPDKHPVAGRSPRDPGLGIFNGLGSKGALLAPGLARQWMNHLTEAVPFDAAVDVRRFAS
jgi:glycine oxidase